MPSKFNKSAATLFERLVFTPPTLADIKSIERAVKKIGDYPCRSHHFYSSTFQTDFRINKLYFAYRWVICFIYFTSCLVILTDPTNSEPKTWNWYFKYPIYLTNINLTLAWLQALMGVVIITTGVKCYGFKKAVPIDEDIQNHQLIYWKLQQLSILVAVSDSVLFWLVINRKNHYTIDLINILGHGIHSFYALSDWLITGLPYNFTDIWISIVYTMAYFLFTFIYWAAGGVRRLKPGESDSDGRVIYLKCTEWDRPDFAIICYFICMSHLALLHVVICALNKLRVRFMLKTPPAPDTPKSKEPELSTV